MMLRDEPHLHFDLELSYWWSQCEIHDYRDHLGFPIVSVLFHITLLTLHIEN